MRRHRWALILLKEGSARMDDLSGQIAAIEHEIEQLRRLCSLAIKVADFREVNRLQAAIGRLITAQDELRARERRRWWRSSSSLALNWLRAAAADFRA